MTLQAVEPTRITIDPRRYEWCTAPELTDVCAIPGCDSKFRLEKHHIVRRSATGGPLDYITIDGLVIQNVCMLCREHHDNITGSIGGHKLWIAYGIGGWQVYRPAYSGDTGLLVDKNMKVWARIGPLRIDNAKPTDGSQAPITTGS